MLKLVKKIYTRPFLSETRSIAEIALYRIICIVVWKIYKIKYRTVLRRTNKFIAEQKIQRDFSSKNAFVFANGPSLSDIDLNKINHLCESGEFDLIAINSYLSKSADVAKPTYAVFADNVHFNDTEGQYKSDINKCKELGITYFAPAKYVKNIKDAPYAYCSLCDIDSGNTNDILQPAGYYGVTAFFALSLACMLGYKKIYICGFDNSYFLDYKVSAAGEMYIHHRHYYDNREQDIRVPCTYKTTSEFFMDVYRHFNFIEKIVAANSNIENIAKKTYLNLPRRNLTFDIYNDVGH